MSHDRLFALVLCVLGVSCASPTTVQVVHPPLAVSLWGPEAPAGSALDPFAASVGYRVDLSYFEDASGQVPYGASFTSEEVAATGFRATQRFEFGAGKTVFALGEAQIVPHRSDGESLYVAAEITGLSADGTAVARARCPVTELPAKASLVVGEGEAPQLPPVTCHAFFGLIGKWSPIAGPSLSRRDFAVAVLGRHLVVAGGRGDTGLPLDSVEAWEIDAADGAEWKILDTKLSAARWRPAFASDSRGLLVAGGTLDSGSGSAAIDRIALDGGVPKVSPAASLTTARATPAAAFMGGRLVVAGGESPGAAGSIDLVSEDLSAVTSVALATGLSAPCLAPLSSERVGICGGGSAACQLFDGAELSALGRLALPRDGARCLSVANTLLVTGGSTGVGGRRIESWRFVSPVAAEVATVGVLDRDLASHALVAVSNALIVSGGGVNGGTDAVAEVHSVDLASGVVTALPPHAAARAGHAVVQLPDASLLAVGGSRVTTAERFVVP